MYAGDMRMRNACESMMVTLDELGIPVSMHSVQDTISTFDVIVEIGSDEPMSFPTYYTAYKYMLGYANGVMAVQSAVLANVKTALGIVSAIGEFK